MLRGVFYLLTKLTGNLEGPGKVMWTRDDATGQPRPADDHPQSAFHIFDNLICREHCAGDIPKVYQCRFVAISQLGMPCSGSCILHHRNFKTLLNQFSHVGFHAKIRRHSCKNNVIYPAFAKLKGQVIILRSIYLMWAGYNGLPIFDVGFESLEPVYPGP